MNNRLIALADRWNRDPIDPLVRRENRFRRETEATLRDLAFLLALTERVKSAILEERDLVGVE